MGQLERSVRAMRVILTGGSSGLGKAIAAALLEAGHELAILSRRGEEKFRETCPELSQASYTSVDLSQPPAENLIASTAEKLGGLDVLINNAGQMAFENAHEAADVGKTMAVNLTSPIQLANQAVAVMLEAEKPGHILNVASVAALKATPKLAAYSASKAGLVQYTRTLAAEYAGRGIRANAICPGAVQTGLTSRVMFAMIAKSVPLGKLQTPEEVAGVVMFLLSDAARNVTGSVYSLDGGMSL